MMYAVNKMTSVGGLHRISKQSVMSKNVIGT